MPKQKPPIDPADAPDIAPTLTADELAAENELLRGRVADLEADLQTCELAYADSAAAVKRAKAARDDGTVAMVLHVAGVAWNGTERRLVRCAPTGPLADAWLVQVGENILLSGGRGTIPARPFLHIPESLQAKVQHTFDDALELARTAK